MITPFGRSRFALLLLAVFGIFAIMGPTVRPVTIYAQGDTKNDKSLVFMPNSKPYGLSLGQWAANWHKWLYSIPSQTNPATDKTGGYCAEKQSGPVWFLAGTTGGSAIRTCTIPSNKAILFPVIASECSFAENPDLKTESDLLRCALGPDDTVKKMDVTIDGVSIPNLAQYRAHTPLFNFIFSKDNIGGVGEGSTAGVADGYWIMLRPLSPGKHTIRFVASSLEVSTTAAPASFVIDTTYNLTIE